MSRTGLSPVMVGRSPELGRLRAALEIDARLGPAVALVSGEAGVGKSRLLGEFVAGIEPPTTLLIAAAQAGDLGRPLELLRDAVESHVAGWTTVPEPLAARAGAIASLLAPVAPGLAGAATETPTREELLRAGVDLIRHLAGGRTAVVVMEDLHWADAESIAFLKRLVLTADLPVLVVGTYRPEDFDRRHPLAELVPALERQRSVVHIALGRLDCDRLGEMLYAIFGRHGSRRAVDALHARTQGNPFFVEELIATAGCRFPDELVDAPLPWNAAEAVLRRLDHLDDPSRCAVEAAAVLGTRVPFDLLSAVSGLDEPALIGVLRGLVARGVLVESEPDVFAFRHALTREAVAGQLLARERRRLHEVALDTLLASGSDDVVALATHASGAARYDTLLAATREGASRFLMTGSALQALKLAELGLAEAGDDVVLRRRASRAAWAVGLVDVASAHAERWRALAIDAADAAEESAALRQLASLGWALYDVPVMWARIDEAQRAAERLGPSEALAWCLSYRSQAHMLTLDHDEAIVLADQALEMAARVGATTVVPHALTNKGSALLDRERSEADEAEGMALLDQARAAAAAINDPMAVARALNNQIAHWTWTVDRPDFATPLIAEALRLSDRHELGSDAEKFASHGAQVAILGGDLDAATQALAEGRRVNGQAVREVWFALQHAILSSERGDGADAAETIARIRPTVGRAHNSHLTTELLHVETVVAARSGDLEAMRAAAAAFVSGAGRDELERWTGATQPAAIELLLGGMPAEEVRAFVAALPRARDAGGRGAVWVDHLDGMLAETDGDLAGACAALERSVAGRGRPRPAFLLAEAYLALARCRAGLGDRARARIAADRAVELLERWPGPRRERAEGLRRRLGAVPGTTARHAASAEGALTPRETEVVALVADGLTNRQIAERLFISTKTAAVHVSNILAKTGHATRTEAAAWAVREGLAPVASAR